MPELITQTSIALTGITAILITQLNKPQWQKYACVFGLAGQPFWIHSAATHAQWGVLTLTLAYTGIWALGMYNHWIKKWLHNRKKTNTHP